MTSDECLSFSNRFDTRQNALRPKRGLLLRRLLIHRLKNLAHCTGLGRLSAFVEYVTSVTYSISCNHNKINLQYKTVLKPCDFEDGTLSEVLPVDNPF